MPMSQHIHDFVETSREERSRVRSFVTSSFTQSDHQTLNNASLVRKLCFWNWALFKQLVELFLVILLKCMWRMHGLKQPQLCKCQLTGVYIDVEHDNKPCWWKLLLSMSMRTAVTIEYNAFHKQCHVLQQLAFCKREFNAIVLCLQNSRSMWKSWQ